MLTHPLAERLRTLGMTAMADTFIEMQNNPAAEDLTREDWLGLLLDREVTARDNKRVGRRLSQARLRQSAVVEDTNFRAARGLDRSLFQKLAGCDWIRHSQHLVISSPTGIGKSWLACDNLRVESSSATALRLWQLILLSSNRTTFASNVRFFAELLSEFNNFIQPMLIRAEILRVSVREQNRVIHDLQGLVERLRRAEATSS